MAQLIPVDHDPFDMSGMLAQAGGLREVSAPDPLISPPRNPARMPQGVEDVARGMTIDPLLDAAKAVRGQMTPDEQRDFAMTAGLGLLSPMARGVKPVTQGIRAYHGSPHDFERFDISKIGTGEGAQSYGHGLYFAENERVARQYRDDLSGMRRSSATSALSRNPDLDAAIAETQQRIAHYKSMPAGNLDIARRDNLLNINQQKLEDLLNLQRGGGLPEGKMYEVNINAKPEQFLDWDKPLANMSEPVRKTLSDAWLAHPEAHAEQTGSQIYAAAGHQRTRSGHGQKQAYAENATAALREAGIPGIKYLDQGSRGSGQGTSNYVVFRDDIVQILRKYGIAGLAALPPAVAASIQSRLIPVDHDPFAQ